MSSASCAIDRFDSLFPFVVCVCVCEHNMEYTAGTVYFVSIDFQCPVYLSIEPKGTTETNTTATQTKAETDQEHVRDINKDGQKSHQFQSGHEEP